MKYGGLDTMVSKCWSGVKVQMSCRFTSTLSAQGDDCTFSVACPTASASMSMAVMEECGQR